MKKERIIKLQNQYTLFYNSKNYQKFLLSMIENPHKQLYCLSLPLVVDDYFHRCSLRNSYKYIVLNGSLFISLVNMREFIVKVNHVKIDYGTINKKTLKYLERKEVQSLAIVKGMITYDNGDTDDENNNNTENLQFPSSLKELSISYCDFSLPLSVIPGLKKLSLERCSIKN